MGPEKPPAILVTGATGAGKSAALYGFLRGHRQPESFRIINADSRTVYRDFRIGTAMPSDDEMLLAPHSLFGFAEATRTFSAGEFRRLAIREMTDATAVGQTPLLVGGTQFYIRALLDGIPDIPAIPPEVRTRVRELDAGILYAELQKSDPESAVRLRTDGQRQRRALEVFLTTGRPLSSFLPSGGQRDEWRWNLIHLDVDRQILYERIDGRVRRMMESGWADEVRKLLTLVPADAPAWSSLGYREIGHDLKEFDRVSEDTKARIAQITRNFAKRQLTWLRNDPWLKKVDPAGLTNLLNIL